LETIERDYAPKGVNFYYVYKALAHPEWDGYVTTYTLEERLMHVKEAKRTLRSRFTWLVDPMDNRFKHAMGSRPNSEFVVGPDGTILASRDWSNAKALRADLERIIGPVEDPTTISDLDFEYVPPPTIAAEGVVPRLERSQRMRALKVEPVSSKNDELYYAKLRAEGGRSLLETGEGELYLRFALDQLYNVHWNNLVDPIRVRIEAPEGVTVTPSTLEGPEVEAEADMDPREFLVSVEGAEPGDVLLVHTSYFPCSDGTETEPGWCRQVEHTFGVTLEGDRDGGTVFPEEMNERMNEMRKRAAEGGG